MSSFVSNLLRSNPVTVRHTVRKVIPTQPQHLFNIITNVDAYSQFLPYCKHSEILRTSSCKSMFDASLRIGIGSARSNDTLSYPWDNAEEEYISRVKMTVDDENTNKVWRVEAKSIKSKLFDGLNSSWVLKESLPPSSPLSTSITTSSHIPDLRFGDELNSESTNSSKDIHASSSIWTNVVFDLEVVVSDPVIVMTLEQLLEKVAKQQVLAFEKRCADIVFE